MVEAEDITRLAPSPLLHRAVRNSFFNGLGTISTFVLGFAFAGLTIRFLGDARAGYLLSLQALIAVNALVAGFGLATPSVRRIAALHARGDLTAARDVVGSVSVVNIATGLIPTLVIVALFPSIFSWSQLSTIYRTDAFWATLFIAGSFLVGQLGSGWQSVYSALQRYDVITGLGTAFGILSGVSGIIILSVAPSLTAITASGFAVAVLRLLCDAYFVRRLLKAIPGPSWNWAEIRPMLRFGGWTFVGSFGSYLFTNLDRIILISFLGSAALPYYAVPQRLYLQIHGSLAGQTQFLFPMLSAFGDQTAAQVRRLEDRLRWLMALLGGTVYLGLIFVGPAVLAKLVSPEFAAAAEVPLILACVQGFVHAQMIVPYYSSWALGSGAPNALASLGQGALVGVTAILLVPRYGFLGASIAQLWIIAIVLVHTLFVRRSIYAAGHLFGWLRAYISPALMNITWILVVGIGIRFVPVGTLAYYGLVVLGGAGGFLVLWLCEGVMFSSDGRWDTLMRAKEIPLNRLRARGLAR